MTMSARGEGEGCERTQGSNPACSASILFVHILSRKKLRGKLTPAVLVLSKFEWSKRGSTSGLNIFFSSLSSTRPRSIAATSWGLTFADQEGLDILASEARR